MGSKEYTNIYVSLKRDLDEYIDVLRIEKIKEDKKNYTKTDIVKILINIGIDVIKGKYLRLDPHIDEFVSKLQNMTIETGDGQKVTIRKSKEQVYNMIIEKGLQHLNE